MPLKITFFPGKVIFFLSLHDMERTVGIDYGKKRTGLAVSDPLGIFASALETVDSAKVVEYLKNYSSSETIVRFVVGWPTNMDGSESESAPGVRALVAKLEKEFPGVPVVLEDERFTSVLAHRAMIDGGMKAKERRDKASVDRISAAIILQSWMDRSSGSRAAFDPAAVPESLSKKNTRRK